MGNAKNKKIVDIQAFNLRSLLCGSKGNKKIKLNANKAIMFSQLLLLLVKVSLIWKSSLVETVTSLKEIYRLGKIKSASHIIFNCKFNITKNGKITQI